MTAESIVSKVLSVINLDKTEINFNDDDIKQILTFINDAGIEFAGTGAFPCLLPYCISIHHHPALASDGPPGARARHDSADCRHHEALIRSSSRALSMESKACNCKGGDAWFQSRASKD